MKEYENKSGVFAPGDVFEKYTIEKLLGRGGMGAVYLVRHNVLDSLFALKVLFPEVARKNKQFVDRFIREAKLACKIKHPNLIAVHDAGKSQEKGVYYLIMDYVSGGSVRDLLKARGRLSPAEALTVIEQTAAALDEAFKYKMVHRDIKPDNIMFTADGVVKLADLGIAKSANEQDTMLTVEASVFGTPAYMSPEQAFDSSSVDCRADIYSLGIVLFEMIAGQRPYKGTGTIEILSQVVKDTDIPDIRESCPEISAEVAKLIHDMTAKQLDKRIATPGELLTRLKKVMSSAENLKCAEKSTVKPVPAKVELTEPIIVNAPEVPAEKHSGADMTLPTMEVSEPPKSGDENLSIPLMLRLQTVSEQQRSATEKEAASVTQAAGKDASFEATLPTIAAHIGAAEQPTLPPEATVLTVVPPAGAAVESQDSITGVPEIEATIPTIVATEEIGSSGEESVSPVQAGEDSDNGGETVVPADVPGASGTDRKKLLLIVAASVLSIFIVSSLILMFSSGKTARPVVPSPPVSSSQPKTEKESGKETADSKFQTEKKQAPAPAPSPSPSQSKEEVPPSSTGLTSKAPAGVQAPQVVPGMIVILGSSGGASLQAQKALSSAGKGKVVFQEAEIFTHYRRQLREIIKSQPRCIILELSEKYAKLGMSLTNFETLIRAEADLLQSKVIPFAFMLSAEEEETPKIKQFNAAIRELCNMRSFPLADTPAELVPIAESLLQKND